MISFIIPSLLKSNKTFSLIKGLTESTIVSEIIFINNSNQQTPDFENTHKLRIVNPGKNLFVNPSWNLGVSLAKCDFIALCNDDIEFNYTTLAKIQKFIESNNIGILGIDDIEYREKTKFSIKLATHRNFGYGTLMFMKKSKYTKIPEELKVWCGDDYLFDNAKYLNYKLSGLELTTKMSTTSSLPEFNEIQNLDKEIYSSIYKPKISIHKKIIYGIYNRIRNLKKAST